MSDARHAPARRRPPAEHPPARGGPRAAGLRDREGGVRARGAREGHGRAGRPRPARHPHARDGRLRGVPRAARGPRDAVPAGRHGHGERRPGEGRGDRGGRGRLHHEAVRPGRARSRASRRCSGSSATTTRSRPRPRSSPSGTASSSSGSPSRSSSSSASAGCGASSRRSSPSSSSSSGDESFLESHRREITVVFCDLRGFTAFAETVEPEDVMVVLARVPRRGRRPRPPLRGHARAVHGRRRRSSSSTTRSRARTRRSGRCGWPSRCATRVGQLAEGWRRQGYDLELRDRHRAGPRDARADRLRGPLRLRGDRQRDQPRRAAVRRGDGRARSSSASASTRRPRTWSPPTRSGTSTLRGFSRPMPRLQRDRARRGARRGHDRGRRDGAAAERPHRGRARRRGSRACRSGSAGVWGAMRLNQPGESIVVVPSVAPDGPHTTGARPAGARGALPVPPAPAPPAAAAGDLRDRAAGPRADRRVLPLAAAGRDPEPRARAPAHGRDARRDAARAGGEADRAPARARRGPRA